MIKTLHILTVTFSLGLFVGRGLWVYLFKKPLTVRWVKIVPHANDSILLLTGIILAINIQQYPFVNDWLSVKIICLLIYIALGFSAMKWHVSSKRGMVSWLLAVMVFLFMLSVAFHHHPAGVFHTL